jgi:hypothetical protein
MAPETADHDLAQAFQQTGVSSFGAFNRQDGKVEIGGGQRQVMGLPCQLRQATMPSAAPYLKQCGMKLLR